jgi:hypothetical protein
VSFLFRWSNEIDKGTELHHVHKLGFLTVDECSVIGLNFCVSVLFYLIHVNYFMSILSLSYQLHNEYIWMWQVDVNKSPNSTRITFFFFANSSSYPPCVNGIIKKKYKKVQPQHADMKYISSY